MLKYCFLNAENTREKRIHPFVQSANELNKWEGLPHCLADAINKEIAFPFKEMARFFYTPELRRRNKRIFMFKGRVFIQLMEN